MAEYALRLTNGTDTAPRVRQGDSLALTHDGPGRTRGGLRADGGGAVTVVAGSMAVQVAPLLAWVAGGTTDAQGGYPFVVDATKTLAIDPGEANLARTDTVAIVVRDNAYDGSGATDAVVRVIKGTPGVGAPALPATALPLRDVIVPAGVSAGTGGLASSHLGADRRSYTAAAGGIVPLTGATERNAMPARDGQVVYRNDTGELELRRAGRWESVRPNENAILYSSDELTLRAAIASVPGLSYTINSPGTHAKWWVDVSLDAERTSTLQPNAVLIAGLGIGAKDYDGTQSGAMIWSPGSPTAPAVGRGAVAKRYLVENLPAGTHNVRVMAGMSTNSQSIKVHPLHSVMAIQRTV